MDKLNLSIKALKRQLLLRVVKILAVTIGLSAIVLEAAIESNYSTVALGAIVVFALLSLANDVNEDQKLAVSIIMALGRSRNEEAKEETQDQAREDQECSSSCACSSPCKKAQE